MEARRISLSPLGDVFAATTVAMFGAGYVTVV
jgi:hypothetical protein